jgi:hypothetical protein
MDILSIFCASTAVAAGLSLIAWIFFSLSAKQSATAKRVSLIFVGVFGVGAVSGCVVLADRDPALQTLPEMQASFATQRSHLDDLQKMSDEDNSLTAIAADYLTAVPSASRPSALYRYGDPQAPLPKARWDNYKSLLEPFGSLASVERTDFGDVTIYTWNGPWRGLFRMTGYTHCTRNPMMPVQGTALRRKPCGEGVLVEGTGPAAVSGDGQPHTRFANYLPLNNGWYAFEIGID